MPLAKADLVIEAASERLSEKALLLLAEVCSAADAAFASNLVHFRYRDCGGDKPPLNASPGCTSSILPLVMKLVEGWSAGWRPPPEVADACELALSWGKQPVRQSTPGFIVNRVARPFYFGSPGAR